MIANRQGYLISDTHRECTKCHKIFPKTSKTVTLCNECNSERVKSTVTAQKKLYNGAQSRARKYNREFSISIDDIVVPTHCPIFGVELQRNPGKAGGLNNSPTLDRIDSNKGYTPDNIWVISRLANAMKYNATDEELVIFAKWVLTGRD